MIQNKLSKLIVFISFIIFFSSCSIYEDIYFKDNATVRYEMKVDASEVLAMMPDLANKTNSSIPSDSIISFAEIIREKVDTTNMTDSDKKDLENVSPLFLNIKNKPDEQVLSLLMYGDFDNIDKLNEALISADRLQEKTIDKASGNSGFNMDRISNLSSYTWDGKKMSRTTISNSAESDDENPTAETAMMSQLFSQGKLIVKYHFPKKVVKINNPKALLSQDGKSVIIEYPASVYKKPEEKMNIEIVTE